MQLANIQKEFASYIYDQNKSSILQYIKNDVIEAEERIGIYHNNIFGSFNSVLENIYINIKILVGDKYFRYMCNNYHQNYYSKSGNLDEYGKQFPQLVKKLIKEHKLSYLIDIAKIDWFYHLSYFSKDVKIFPIEKFQKLEENNFFKLKFKIHPSCYLIKSLYPIFKIWEFCQNNQKNKKIDLSNLSSEFILIERVNSIVNIHNLSMVEYNFLQKIKKGQDIYKIYTESEFDFDIGLLINKYVSNQIFYDFVIE